MNNFADIVNRWPTPQALTDDLRALGVVVSVVTVRSWRKRGINGEYWQHVYRAGKARGYRAVTLKKLCALGARVVSERNVSKNSKPERAAV